MLQQKSCLSHCVFASPCSVALYTDILVRSISVEHWLAGYVSPTCTCNKYETHSGGSKPWSYMFPGYLTSYSEYTTKERTKMGRYGTKNGLAKAARHFSQLLHCNSAMRLASYCSSNIILWLRDQIAKFKIRRF